MDVTAHDFSREENVKLEVGPNQNGHVEPPIKYLASPHDESGSVHMQAI